jgi:putative lipoprotein
MRALVLALALSACAAQTPPPADGEGGQHAQDALAAMPSWEQARAAGVDFRAVGSEPGWMLDIYQQDRIVLLWDYGQASAEFPLTEPSYPRNGAISYAARANGHVLSVTIRRFPCSDPMSGENFPASVEAVIDGRTLSGCGRSV